MSTSEDAEQRPAVSSAYSPFMKITPKALPIQEPERGTAELGVKPQEQFLAYKYTYWAQSSQPPLTASEISLLQRHF